MVASWRQRQDGDDVPRLDRQAELDAFRRTVLAHYQTHARELPWRQTQDPYRILVSEVMLQQTQVARVLPKYEEFVLRFPDLGSLAEAPVATVLAAWQGLGYNRRALALQHCAQMVTTRFGGILPCTEAELRALPGVGPATAASLLAFAHGVAVPFIETNIRAAVLHFFFPDREDVPDSELLPLVAAALDRDDPRTWYYALMDYGHWLKKALPNPSRRSRHHTHQSPYEGSNRQLRAQILRLLLAQTDTLAAVGERVDGVPRGGVADESAAKNGAMTSAEVAAQLPDWPQGQVETALTQLAREGFLREDGMAYALA